MIFFGGGTEIRTQGDFRHDSFQDCCIKPLCHPSVYVLCIVEKRRSLSKLFLLFEQDYDFFLNLFHLFRLFLCLMIVAHHMDESVNDDIFELFFVGGSSL